MVKFCHPYYGNRATPIYELQRKVANRWSGAIKRRCNHCYYRLGRVRSALCNFLTGGISGRFIHMLIGTCTIELYLAEVNSLKEKRSSLKSLLNRLHKEFHVAAAEVGLHDVWKSSTIGVATISTSAAHAQNLLSNLVGWIEQTRPDLEVVDHYVELVTVTTGAGN